MANLKSMTLDKALEISGQFADEVLKGVEELDRCYFGASTEPEDAQRRQYAKEGLECGFIGYLVRRVVIVPST